jgi:hypothetical protein
MSDPSQSKPRRNRARRPSAEPAPDRATGGPDPADPAALAERFLDLWQDQLAAVATDPDLAEQVARLWSQWLVGPTAWRPAPAAAPARPCAARPARSREPPRHHDTTGQAGDAEAPRATPAAAASGDRGADVGDLLARIGTLEKRLAALERTPRRSRGGAERRTRRR